MPASFSHAQIERFKREAKSLHRAQSISHSQALDHIAASNGYSNWSLLMKHSEADGSQAAPHSRPWRKFSRSTAEMRQRLRSVPVPRMGGGARDQTARQQVEDISGSLVSAPNAVAFAIDYVTSLLTVPRFRLYSAAPAYWEMRSWLPYSCNPLDGDLRILVNRGYQPVGQVEKAWVRYEDFPRFHARLSPDQRKRITAPGSSDGYLSNDGCPPWESRVDAAAYLERLRRLREIVSS